MRTPILVIVEGDEYLGDAMVRQLQDRHYDATLIGDGALAINAIRGLKPQLVVMDVSLPHLNGEQIMTEKGRDPNLAIIPTIMITHSGDADEVDRVLALGAKDYIIKSEYNPEDFITKVRQQLDPMDLFPKKVVEKEREAMSMPPLYGKKVVLIDLEGDAFLTGAIARKFIAEGVKFVRVVRDELMLRRVENESPDVVLLDVVSSDVLALDTLKNLKAYQGTKATPVLILSNIGEVNILKACMVAGAANFLIKATASVEDIVAEVKRIAAKARN